MTPPALVPELGCADLDRSRRFYCEALHFRCVYERRTERFARLDHHGARLMLEELDEESWLAAPAEPPLGRGMHLQIGTPVAVALLQRCRAESVRIERGLEDAWYRADATYVGQRQFVVRDPDGYLLRFAQPLGYSVTPREGRRLG